MSGPVRIQEQNRTEFGVGRVGVKQWAVACWRRYRCRRRPVRLWLPFDRLSSFACGRVASSYFMYPKMDPPAATYCDRGWDTSHDHVPVTRLNVETEPVTTCLHPQCRGRERAQAGAARAQREQQRKNPLTKRTRLLYSACRPMRRPLVVSCAAPVPAPVLLMAQRHARCALDSFGAGATLELAPRLTADAMLLESNFMAASSCRRLASPP